MIKIILDGEEALDYLKTQGPDTETLVNSLTTATQYIDVLEKQIKNSTEEVPQNLDDPMRHNISGSMNRPAGYKPSTSVLKATAILKELDEEAEKTKAEITEDLIYTAWGVKDWGIKIPIRSSGKQYRKDLYDRLYELAIAANSYNKTKSIEYVYKTFGIGRNLKTFNEKLSNLGFKVESGLLQLGT